MKLKNYAHNVIFENNKLMVHLIVDLKLANEKSVTNSIESILKDISKKDKNHVYLQIDSDDLISEVINTSDNISWEYLSDDIQDAVSKMSNKYRF